MKKPNPLLEDLKPILPVIAANAFQAEKDRSVPAENIALLKSIGMHRAFQPKPYGGMEISCRSSPIASRCWPVPVPARPGP